MAVVTRWYFRIDSNQYGPVEAAYLEKLLAPPRLVQRIDVRPESRSVQKWFSIGPQEDLTDAGRYFDVELTAPVSEAPELPVSKDGPRYGEAVFRPLSTLAGVVGKYRWVILFVATWLALNAAVYQYVISPDQREREYLRIYSEIWSQLQQMRTEKEVSGEDWEPFAKEARTRIEPIVAELNRSTDADDPVRRSLLWAGRDCLLPLLSSTAPPEEGDRLELAFVQHLEAVKQALGE